MHAGTETPNPNTLLSRRVTVSSPFPRQHAAADVFLYVNLPLGCIKWGSRRFCVTPNGLSSHFQGFEQGLGLRVTVAQSSIL